LAKDANGVVGATEHGEVESDREAKITAGSLKRTLVVAEHEIGVVDAGRDERVKTASFLICRKASLQKAAIAADVGESGKDVGVPAAPRGAIEESLHRVERTALIDLKRGVEIMGEREVGAELQGLLKVLISGAKTFAGTELIFVPKPASAAEPGPRRSIGGIGRDAAFVHFDGSGQVFPLTAIFIGAQIEFINGGAGGAFLLEGLLLAGGERGQNGINNTANEVVVELEEFVGGALRGVGPQQSAAGRFDELGGDTQLLAELEESSSEDDIDFSFGGDLLEIG